MVLGASSRAIGCVGLITRWSLVPLTGCAPVDDAELEGTSDASTLTMQSHGALVPRKASGGAQTWTSSTCCR